MFFPVQSASFLLCGRLKVPHTWDLLLFFAVCCYVWEGTKVKKLNFTLLDIGWRIIQVFNAFYFPPFRIIALLGVMSMIPIIYL